MRKTDHSPMKNQEVTLTTSGDTSKKGTTVNSMKPILEELDTNGRQTENLHLTPEMEFLQMGYRINHLIGLIESLYKKDIQERDRLGVMRFRNLLDTLETVTNRRYKYLHQELLNTEENLEST